jgi:hypothetical protein
MRQTRTYVELDLPRAVWDLIHAKLDAAGYEHAIDMQNMTLDMQGIGIIVSDCPDGCRGSGREMIDRGHGDVADIPCSLCTPQFK